MIEGIEQNLSINKRGIQTNATGNIRELLKLAKQHYEKYQLKLKPIDLENAIDYYIRILKNDPKNAEAHYKLSSLLWDKGEIDTYSAICQCKKAVELDPASSEARLYMGYFLNLANSHSEAKEEFIKAIRLNPILSARARFALALTLIKKIHSTTPTFNDFITLFYSFSSGCVVSCWDYTSLRGMYKNLREDLSVLKYRINGQLFKSMNKYNQAVKTYEIAAENTRCSDFFYTKKADLSLKNGNIEEAVKSYKQALKVKPDNPETLVKLASTYQAYRSDKNKEIVECYSRLAKIDPVNPKIYYELGHMYIKLNDKFSAVNAFKKALELDNDNPFYLNSLAYALIQLKDYDGAIENYEKAIKVNPDNEWTAVVCQALGAIYHEVKCNCDAAIVAYQTSTVLDDNNADAYISLGEVYYDKGELDKAIENFCKAIKLDPDRSKTYCYLGMCLWDTDKLEEAAVSFQKATSIDPKNAIAFNNLGVVYLDGIGDPYDALTSFNNSIQANPNYALAYFNKGRCLEVLGNKTEAADVYQMALNLNKITEEMNGCEIEERLYNLFKV